MWGSGVEWLSGHIASRPPGTLYQHNYQDSPSGELGGHKGMRGRMPYAVSPVFERGSDNDNK